MELALTIVLPRHETSKLTGIPPDPDYLAVINYSLVLLLKDKVKQDM